MCKFKFLTSLLTALMLLASTGCASPTETKNTETVDQDFAFSVALQQTVQDAHADEMAAINSQAVILNEINTTLTAMAANDAAKEEAVKAAAQEATRIMLDEWPENIRVVYWTGTPCVFCEKQSPIIDILEDAGIKVRRIVAFEEVDGETKYSPEAVEFGVTDCPRVWLCQDDSKLAEFVGVATIEQMLDKAKAVKAVRPQKVSLSTDAPETCTCVCKDGVCLCKENGKTCVCVDENGNPCTCSKAVKTVTDWQSTPETWPARVPIDGSIYPSKETLIWHLRGGGSGGQNHVNSYYHAFPLDQMTAGQLVTLHDADHPVVVRQATQQTTRQVRYYTGPLFRFRSNTCRNGRCR